MRISRRLLQPGERLVTSTGLHPVRLLVPLVTTIVTIAAATALGYFATPTTTDDPLDLICAAVALFALARFARRFMSWRRQRVVVTDQRLLRLSGGVLRRVGSVALDQVSQVDLVQGLFGRLLGYGRLEIQAATERVVLPTLRDAPELWAVLCETTGLDDGVERRSRRLAPGLPFDQQDTGPLPRILV